MTIKIYEALDIINLHVSEGVEIAPNELYRIDEKYVKLDDLRETDKLSVEKLQKQLNTAKKALTESEEKYQKQWDRFLNSEMNEQARSHCESMLKLLFPAHKAYETLEEIEVTE